MIKEVSIYKPGGVVASYRVGVDLFSTDAEGKREKVDYKVKKISEDAKERIIKVVFTNKMVFTFKGFPYIIEQ